MQPFYLAADGSRYELLAMTVYYFITYSNALPLYILHVVSLIPILHVAVVFPATVFSSM